MSIEGGHVRPQGGTEYVLSSALITKLSPGQVLYILAIHTTEDTVPRTRNSYIGY